MGNSPNNLSGKDRSAVLIVNTRSRKGQQYFIAALQELSKQGLSVAESYPVKYPERLPEVVREAVKQKHKLIIIGGGDGTISSAVRYLAHQEVVLGILPFGTANSFARTLGIPLDLKKAVKVIVTGEAIEVDLGKAGYNYFSNVVAIGLTAKIAREITPGIKLYTGVMAYGLMGIKSLFSHRPFACTITMNNEAFRFDTHQVVIVNGGYFGITPIAPYAKADDQEFIVFVMDTISRWDTLKLWTAFLLRKANVFSQARFFRTREVILEATPTQYVEVDGEIITKTPVHISLAAKALKVMVCKN